MLFRSATLGLLFWALFTVFRRRPGLTFFVFLITYSVLRYLWTFFRVDSAVTFVPFMRVPQLTSVIMLIVSIAPVIWLLRQPPVEEVPPPAMPAGRIPARRG